MCNPSRIPTTLPSHATHRLQPDRRGAESHHRSAERIDNLGEDGVDLDIDELPVDRAIARITAAFLRTGTQYTAAISQADTYCDPADIERTIRPIRDVLGRGVGDRVLRDDLPADTMLQLSALLERALWLTVSETVTPEEATDTVVGIFLDGCSRL